MKHFKRFSATISLAVLCSLQVACSAGTSLNKDDNSAESAQAFDLERVWQRTLRYDCSGALASDKYETVQSATQMVNLPPKDSTHLYSRDVQNVATSDIVKTWIGDSFQINISPTVFDLQVNPGVNELRYSFSYCDEYKLDPQGIPTSECAVTPDVRESGSVFINVTYNQTYVDKPVEIHPDPKDCSAR